MDARPGQGGRLRALTGSLHLPHFLLDYGIARCRFPGRRIGHNLCTRHPQGAPLRSDTVEDVKTFIIDSLGPKNWVFVRVATHDGVIGWGECYTAADREGAIATLADRLGSYLIGRRLTEIRHFTRVAYLDIGGKRGSMELFCALSGLEMAMWDAFGKSVGEPVYNLLGGPNRTRLRVYANGWTYNSSGTPGNLSEAVENAAALVERGFTALKFDPFQGPWRAHLEHGQERAAVEAVSAIRDAVGPDTDILVEVHRRLNARSAARMARLLEPLDPFWFEEPVSSKDIPGLHDVRSRTSIPVVSGEELYTKVEFRPLLEARAVDIINPDVAACGGILELLEIAAMADSYGVAVAPHNYNSTTIGLAATITASAAMPSFLITEYFVNFEERGKLFSDQTFVVQDGFIAVSEEPGLGIELDEAALTAAQRATPKTRDVRRAGDE